MRTMQFKQFIEHAV